MRQRAAPYQAIPRQPYQSWQSQHVYQHVEEKEVYQIDDKPSLEVNEDPPENETYYTNESYNKLQINLLE